MAAHAGLGVGTVYRRFPDKQALIEALFDSAMDEHVATAERAASISDPWRALVHLLNDLTMRAAGKNGLRQVIASHANGKDRFAEARKQLVLITTRVLRCAQEDGAVRADVEHIDLALLWRMSVHIAEQTAPARPDAWQRYLEFALDSLRVHPGQQPLAVPPLSDADAAAIVTPLTHPNGPGAR